MNLWLQQAEPLFEVAAAMEFLGFTGPQLPEGMAALKDWRRWRVVPTS